MSTCKYTYVSTISNSNVRIGSRPEVTLSVPLIWFPLGVIHPGLSLTFILWNRYQGFCITRKTVVDTTSIVYIYRKRSVKSFY